MRFNIMVHISTAAKCVRMLGCFWRFWRKHSSQSSCFTYERSTSSEKFNIVAKIFFLLKKICERRVSLGIVFKVKTLSVSWRPYPREMKTNTGNFKLSPFWRRYVSMEMTWRNGARALILPLCRSHHQSISFPESSFPLSSGRNRLQGPLSDPLSLLPDPVAE